MIRIYKTTDILNGKIYIGQTNKAENYIGSGVLLTERIKEIGKNKFSHETIVSGNFNKELSNELEKHYIRLYNSNNPDIGYNLTSGGKSLMTHSLESRKKMSLALMGNTWNIGRKPSELNRKMVQEAAKKKKLTVEQKSRMLEGRKRMKFQNIGARKVDKSVIFKILENRNKLTRIELANLANVSKIFIDHLLYRKNHYKDWKNEFNQIKLCENSK